MTADELPTPMETLEKETKQAEEELTKVREETPNETDEPEELAEESLPSEDEEESEPDQPEESEVEEQDSVPEVPKDLSPRGQERFKDLTGRLKKTAAENEQLKAIVQTLQSQGYTKKQAQEMAPGIQEIDPNQDPQAYAQQVLHQAREVARKEIEHERTVAQHQQKVERFQEDLQTIEKEYEVLNEDSPEYDEKLSNFVAEVYENRSNKDPKVRLIDITKEVMEVRNKGAEEAVSKESDKIRKKAASQAIPSSGGKGTMRSLADQLKEVDSEKELMELRKQIPLGD